MVAHFGPSVIIHANRVLRLKVELPQADAWSFLAFTALLVRLKVKLPQADAWSFLAFTALLVRLKVDLPRLTPEAFPARK